MHKERDIAHMLSQLQAPEAASNFEERILQAARQHNPVLTRGPESWWRRWVANTNNGPKLALVASFAAIAILIGDPVGYVAKQRAEARYMAAGLNLLEDVDLVEDPVDVAFADDADSNNL